MVQEGGAPLEHGRATWRDLTDPNSRPHTVQRLERTKDKARIVGALLCRGRFAFETQPAADAAGHSGGTIGERRR